MTHYTDALRSAQSLFVRPTLPNGHEWKALVELQELGERYPGLRSLAWIPRVERKNVPAFEASLRAQGQATFRIWDLGKGPSGPLPDRDEYHPIAFIEPSQPAALGLDTASRPLFFQEVISPARNRAEVILSNRIQPVEDPSNVSFGMVAPVYRNKARPAAVADRKELYLGQISAMISADRFFNGLDFESLLRLAVYDDSERGTGTLIWASEKGLNPSFEARFETRRECVLFGRRWVIKCWSTPGWEQFHGQGSPWGIWAGGLTLALGCSGALAWVARGKVEAELELEENSGALEAMSASLQQESRDRKTLEQAKASVVSMVSRELRPPLTSARSGIRLLETSGGLRQDQAEYLAMAERNLDRLVRVLDILVDQEALAEGNLTIELRPLVLATALEEARSLVRHHAEAQQVTVHLDAQDGVRVHGDAFRLRQVLVSLLSQNIERARPGSEFWIWADPPAEGRIRVSLHDPSRPAGKAVPGRDADLSLLHAKAVVEALGGRFGAVDVEKGHTLWLELPIV
jgi:CHASE1-domain containing sensor protein